MTSGGRRRRHIDGDDPAVLADLSIPAEPGLLERREHTVVEEAGRDVAGGFRVGLDRPATEAGDQLERAGERSRRDALAAMALAHVATGDPPVGQSFQLLLVFSVVLDSRHLVRRSELTPADAVIAVENECRVRSPGSHAVKLLLPMRLDRV